MGFRDGGVHLQTPYRTPTVFGNQPLPSNRKLDCVKSLIFSLCFFNQQVKLKDV